MDIQMILEAEFMPVKLQILPFARHKMFSGLAKKQLAPLSCHVIVINCD